LTASEIDGLGATSPTVPEPPPPPAAKKGCGGFVRILALVVAVVVAAVVTYYAGPALGSKVFGAMIGAAAGSVAS
jgi:hypothetical protein